MNCVQYGPCRGKKQMLLQERGWRRRGRRRARYVYFKSTKTSSKCWESDQNLIRELRVGGLDQFRFLYNCLPTPPLSQHLTLTSHIGQNVGLGEG